MVEDGTEDILVDTLFSLAYGALLLLSHTTLRLVRGRRYGICASNGSGKSTLLRAIVDGKVRRGRPYTESSFPKTVADIGRELPSSKRSSSCYGRTRLARRGQVIIHHRLRCVWCGLFALDLMFDSDNFAQTSHLQRYLVQPYDSSWRMSASTMQDRNRVSEACREAGR